jgi:hypothetical protein
MLEEISMTTRAVFVHRGICLVATALLFASLASGGTGAQEYLGKARQNCIGNVVVKAQGKAVNVAPFQAVTADIGSDQVTVSCQDQPPVTVQCPSATNRVLIDRTQGSNIYSIICLKR